MSLYNMEMKVALKENWLDWDKGEESLRKRANSWKFREIKGNSLEI